MFESNGVTFQYIGTGNVDTVANTTKINSYADLTAGALAVVDEENKAVKGTLATGKVRVVQRVGNTLVYSPFFDMAKVQVAIHEDYSAALEQISYVGYNGTTGELDEITNTTFVLQFILEHTAGAVNNSPFIKTVPFKTSTALQKDLALGWLQSANAVFKTAITPYSSIKFERVLNEAVDAANDFLGDATVVKGTKSFTVAESSGAAGDGGDYATSTSIVVGDWVRIGTVGGGTALTSSVYRVTAVADVSSALCTITVDDYIVAASGTYAAATSDIEVIASATVDGDTNFGIKMTGIKPPTFSPETDTYDKVRYHVTSEDFVNAAFTTSQEAYEGTGVYEQISVQELFSFMNEGGGRFRTAYPSLNARSEAAVGTTYSQITVTAYDDEFSDIVGNNPKSNVSITLALYAGSTQYTELKTVLGSSAA